MNDSGATWRILLHALDRTGPPILAICFASWVRHHRPDDSLEFLAFRGGPLCEELERLGTVSVVLDHHEAWDHFAPSAGRAQELTRRLSGLGRVDANLLVSVAAGQALPLLPSDIGPIVTWAVEVEEDLHWVSGPVGLVERTDRWLAGSSTTLHELRSMLEPELEKPSIELVPEFVTEFAPPHATDTLKCRHDVGVGDDDLLVIGMGIGTHRKGLDLFLEVAVHARHGEGRVPTFVWIGGEGDPIFRLVHEQLRRFDDPPLILLDSRPDVRSWLAAADVFCHTARADAFPLVCLQAALAGTPVIAFSGSRGVAEMFGTDFVGAPFPDVHQLGLELDVLRDRSRREAVGAAQQMRVRRNYTSEVAAERLYAALQEQAS